VSELAVDAPSRRGRAWVLLALGLALLALGYAVVDISTREAGPSVVRVDGATDAQRLFGGLPQAGDRLGSSDAPVSIQVFNDLQCSSCRDDFLSTIPAIVEEHVRPGEAKLLMRHYSVARNALELGFFGAEAAARQGYGWQYTYLFFRNQDEAERLGIDDELMASLAGSIDELELAEWRETFDREEGADGPDARGLRRAGHPARDPRWSGDDRQRPARHPHPAGRPGPRPNRAGDHRSGIIASSRGVAQPGSAHRSGR
jgi:Thioredoxin